MARNQERLRGARSSRTSWRERLLTYFRHHRMEMHRSLHELIAAPGATLMTVLVLAVALALPAGLQVALKNSQQIADGLDNASRVSLFLQIGTREPAVQRLKQTLRLRADILQIRIITPERGLAEFEQRSGFGDALKYLQHNPLPYVMVITPSSAYTDPRAAAHLLRQMQQLPLVDKAQLDLDWVRRLHAMVDVAKRAVQALGFLFALAVILVIGNTIRLAIESHRAEIQVVKLVGATNAFIRRPYLYTGIWFGLGGALMAWLMVTLALQFVSGPVADLASAYGSSFELQGIAASELLLLLSGGALLGWLGAWLSVSRHINEIEPG